MTTIHGQCGKPYLRLFLNGNNFIVADAESSSIKKTADVPKNERSERLFSPDPRIFRDAFEKGPPALEELLEQLDNKNFVERLQRAAEHDSADWLAILSKYLARDLNESEQRSLN